MLRVATLRTLTTALVQPPLGLKNTAGDRCACWASEGCDGSRQRISSARRMSGAYLMLHASPKVDALSLYLSLALFRFIILGTKP